MRRPGQAREPEIDYLPPDLAPLPYGAGAEDDEAIRASLYLNFGNVGLAARQLGCLPGQLARRIELLPSLKADRDAARRMIVDQAEAVVVEELLDTDNEERRSETARFVLTSLGKSLGWGSQATSQAAGFSLSDGSGKQLTVRWQTDVE